MKRHFLLLSLFCVCVCSVFLTSCKDEDKKKDPTYTATLTVDPSSATLYVNETIQITATAKLTEVTASAVEAEITYSSDKTDIVEVSENGLVTAKKVGKAVITIECQDAKKTVPITVKTLTLIPATAETHVGKKIQFETLDGVVKATGVTYTSSDATTASIDAATGLATGIKVGTVTITATKGKTSVSKELTVGATIVPTAGSFAIQTFADNAVLDKLGDNDNTSFFGGATRFSAVNLLANAEKVVGVSFLILDDAARFTVEVYEDNNGTPAATALQSKTVTRTSASWNYFEFDSPLVPEYGKSYWFALKGYTGNSFLGWTVNNTSNRDDYKYYYKNNWNPFKLGSTYGMPAMKVMVEGGNYANEVQNQLNIMSVVGADYLRPGDKYTVKANIVNFGVVNAQNFEAVLSVDGTEYRKAFTNADLHNAQGVDFEIGDYIAPDVDKKVNVQLSIVNNEGAVGNPYTTKVPIYKTTYTRTAIFIDQFTSQDCPNCPPGERVLQASVDGMDSPEAYAWVSHHVGYREDIFTIEASRELLKTFRVAGNPSMLLNRMQQSGRNDLDFHPGNSTKEMLNRALTFPSFASLNIVRNYNEASRELTITVSGETGQAVLNMNVYLIQNNMIARQSNGGDDYSHEHVVRANIAGLVGVEVTPAADGTYTKSFTYTVPEKVDNLDVVAANSEICVTVGKQNVADQMDNMIYNAARISLVGSTTSVGPRMNTEVAAPQRIQYLSPAVREMIVK